MENTKKPRLLYLHSIMQFMTFYLRQGQFTEEQILDNNENSPMFEEFLQLLGDKVRLRGFDKYKGGLGKNGLKYDSHQALCNYLTFLLLSHFFPPRYCSRLNGTVLCLHKLAKY